MSDKFSFKENIELKVDYEMQTGLWADAQHCSDF